MNVRRLGVFAGTMAALGVVAWGAHGASSRSDKEAAAGDAKGGSSELVAPALVEAEGDVVSLAFDTTGRVIELRVAEGDRVHVGDLLARLDDRLPRAAVARAEAAVAAAEARRDAADRGPRPEEIRAARAESEAARAQAAVLGRDGARAAKLEASGALAAAARDSAAGASDAAHAQADAAEARWALLRAGTREEQRREAVAAVAVARADLDEARARLLQTELRAPRNGVVVRHLVEPGEQVTSTPLTIVLRLADVDHVRLRAEVDEADIGRVTVGQTGWATAEALGGRRLAAHVLRVERELGRKTARPDDPRARVDTRVLEVLMALDDPPLLPLGLRVDAHFDAPR